MLVYLPRLAGILGPAGEGLINSRQGLPFKSVAPPGGASAAGPGRLRGQRLRPRRRSARLHREPAGCLSERRPKSSGRRRGCRALSGRHCALRVTRNPLRDRIPWGLLSPCALLLAGSPVTRPPPAHSHAFLFLPKGGLSGGKETSADFKDTAPPPSGEDQPRAAEDSKFYHRLSWCRAVDLRPHAPNAGGMGKREKERKGRYFPTRGLKQEPLGAESRAWPGWEEGKSVSSILFLGPFTESSNLLPVS